MPIDRRKRKASSTVLSLIEFEMKWNSDLEREDRKTECFVRVRIEFCSNYDRKVISIGIDEEEEFFRSKNNSIQFGFRSNNRCDREERTTEFSV